MGQASTESTAYGSADEFLHDLTLVQESLRQNNGARMADGRFANLVQQARIFGFHLATLDIRQHSERHRQAMSTILHRYYSKTRPDFNYTALPEADMIQLLQAELASDRPLTARLEFDDETNETIGIFRLIRKAHVQVGPQAVQSYIISMTTSASNMLEVLLLAKDAGLFGQIDVVPLFETIEDLQNAPEIMRRLFEIPIYQEHLRQRGQHQQIMIGYSDSNKDGGYLPPIGCFIRRSAHWPRPVISMLSGSPSSTVAAARSVVAADRPIGRSWRSRPNPCADGSR